jgi:predicted phage terminase large subunit-like protein
VVATRWHLDDLSGWLLKNHAREGWKVISLPAIAEADDALGRAEGEALWPEQFPTEMLDRIHEAIGSAAWRSLYQQRPVSAEGSIFRREWLKSYTEQPECRRVILSLDTAFKTKQSSDYSAIAIIGESKNSYHLLQMWRGRVEFPALQAKATDLAAIWKPSAVLIEDAASGQSLIQTLQAETRLPIMPVRPRGDKVARASAVTPLFESGRVFLPESVSWRAEFEEELLSFPAADHDDQVDSIVQGLSYLAISDRSGMDYDFQTRAAAELRAAAKARASFGLNSESNFRGSGERWAAEQDEAERRSRTITSYRWGRRGAF